MIFLSAYKLDGEVLSIAMPKRIWMSAYTTLSWHVKSHRCVLVLCGDCIGLEPQSTEIDGKPPINNSTNYKRSENHDGANITCLSIFELGGEMQPPSLSIQIVCASCWKFNLKSYAKMGGWVPHSCPFCFCERHFLSFLHPTCPQQGGKSSFSPSPFCHSTTFFFTSSAPCNHYRLFSPWLIYSLSPYSLIFPLFCHCSAWSREAMSLQVCCTALSSLPRVTPDGKSSSAP